MSELKGNKGEWSEIFTFLNVLGKGRIYGADGDVELIDDMVLNVDKVIRNEDGGTIEYIIDSDAGLVNVVENEQILATVSQEEAIEHSELILDAINVSSSSFSIPSVENFMRRIVCHKLKAPSHDKTDITMELYDPRAGYRFEQGFSIKSMLGSPSTLLNASNSTNFVFKLTGNVTPEIVNEVNNRRRGDKLVDKFRPFEENEIHVEFIGMDSDTFHDNLELIDSSLPLIVAEMLKLHYLKGVSEIEEQVKKLTKNNPLNYRTREHPHYEYKIKKFLVSCALGMVPKTPWTGREDANGGILIVREDGKLACYHIYDRNEFENQILKDTKLDTPSTRRHGFSFIEQTPEGDYILKLNLQIRFK